MTLQEIFTKHRDDINEVLRGFALSDELYEDLYHYFATMMPYGTATAKTGDPHLWLTHRLYEVMQGFGNAANVTFH